MKKNPVQDFLEKMDNISVLDQKLDSVVKNHQSAMLQLCKLKFKPRYENLHPNSFRVAPSFTALSKNESNELILTRNTEESFLLPTDPVPEEELTPAELEIVQEVTDSFAMVQMNKLEEFIEMNNKIQTEIDRRLKEYRERTAVSSQEGKSSSRKFFSEEFRFKSENGAELIDGKCLFNSIDSGRGEVKNVQKKFRNLVESCVELVNELRKIEQKRNN